MTNTFIHIKKLILRLLIVVLIFEVCRLLFLIFNFDLFRENSGIKLASTFYYGLFFDISAIIYFNLLFIALHILPLPLRDNNYYKTFNRYLFFVTNGVAILLNIIDIEYFKFSKKRTGADIFSVQDDVKNLFTKYVVDYWYLLLIWIGLMALLIVLYKLTINKKRPVYNKVSIIKQFAALVIVALLSFIGLRGGLYLIPLRPVDAARFVDPQLAVLATNTPIKMIHTIGTDKLELIRYFDEKDLKKLYDPIHYPKDGKEFKRENVVIIILESFGKEFIGFYNDYKGYTPFFDSLCKQSLVFPNSYANCVTSNTALPTLLSGIPSWMDVPYLNSSYSDNKITSIGKLLKSKGYQTAFFHGGRNGTMSFDTYISLADFGEYYGMNEYPQQSDFDGFWGIPDELYLQYFADKLNSMPQPFCASVFTLSSHHPYKIPLKYQSKFKGSDHPIYKSIEYSDFALQKFFESASKTDWYKNTLFVITADHTAYNKTPFYQTMAGIFAVPVIFYKPDSSLQGINQKIIQQIDIMPSILEYLNYDEQYFSFGNNAFDTTKSGWALQFHNNVWQFISDNYVLFFDGNKSIKLYDYSKDPLMKENLIDNEDINIKGIENKLKAIIQSYYSHLINNSMN